MRRLLIPLFILAPVFACAQTSPGPLTPEQWRADLAYLAKELPARHINAFATIPKAGFQAEVKDLDERIPKLADGAIRAGMLKIVASLGDGHTNLRFQRGSFHPLPLIFYWYKDGVLVIAATEPYRHLLGSKLAKVGGLNVDEVCRRLSVYVPHENDAQVKVQIPNMLIRIELLQEVGAAEPGKPVRLELDRNAVDLEPYTGQPQWTWAYTGEPPLYQREHDVPYSATVLERGTTVYFRYNQCVNNPKNPFPKFADDLKKMLAQPGVNRLIIDLRNNGGGDSAILDPFIGWLKSSRFNRKGSLYVLIGRPTFSSAILNAARLKNETAATLAGEPTGGKPNHFGEVKGFELPNSRIVVSYSTKHFHPFKEDTPTIVPDVLVEPASEDYLKGMDPVLAAVMR
jgi:hypothetical protein